MHLFCRVCLVLALVINLSWTHPLPEDAPDASTSASELTPVALPQSQKDSKVYADMLQILQDVEQSQATLQAAIHKQPSSNRREDNPTTGQTDSAPAKLLDMEHIVKALESVASTLSKGSKGLTADASSTDEALLRNERDSGYGVPSTSYGPNTLAETPSNFINVFSQAAANTVNFATQLLTSLVGVAANILQGTVSTLLSLLNAKGQIVGAVVQSAPPVLASVTRTAGDVLAAKARIFGAVTQSAVNFASQLAATVTNTFSGLFNGPNAINWNTLGRRGDREAGSGALSGIGNLGQTIVNSQLHLLNGILAPFVNGGGGSGSRASSAGTTNPFAALFGGGSGSGSSSNPFAALFGGSSNPLAALFRSRSSPSPSESSASVEASSEPNFRITIRGGGGSSSSSTSSSSNNDEPATPIEPEEDNDTK